MSARRLDASDPAGLGPHRGRRPHHPHRRDQPAQCFPGRRCRYRAQTCCSPCVRRGRRPTRSPRGDDVAQVAAALARGALQGARGNSGVILSQILRGLADVTAAAAGRSRRGAGRYRRGPVRGRPAACGRPGRHVDGRGCPRHDRLGAAGRGRRRRAMPPPTAPTSPTWWSRPPTPRPSRSTRPPGSSMCWPRPAWWTPAAAGCWYCWTR